MSSDTKQDPPIRQIQNPIVNLIKLSRKLLNCDQSELPKFMHHIIHIFIKHNKFDIIQSILLNAFHANYKNIPSQIYEEIDKTGDDILSQLKLDDSFPKVDEDNDNFQSPPNSLLLIPKDLICYSLNFLDMADIFSISKTCRYLTTIACDPNSIYHITVNGIIDFNHCSTDIRYSKIKSLKLTQSFPGLKFEPNSFANICKVWKKLECLNVCGNERSKSWKKDGILNTNIFNSLKKYFPCTLNLKRLSLNIYNDYFDKQFMIKQINPMMLQYLSLQNISISMQRIECLMQFSNLKMLSLTQLKYPVKKKEDFGSLLLLNKKYINALYPFWCLEEFKTDSTIINETYIDVINWILMNGIPRKSLILILNIEFPLQLNQKSFSRFMISLNTLNKLHIDLKHQNSIYPFTPYLKLCNLNFFTLSSNADINSKQMQMIIENIIKYGKASMVTQLICDISNGFEWFQKWINLHFCNQNMKFFGTIQLNIKNNVNFLNNTDHNHKDYEISNGAKHVITTNVVNEFKAIEWFLNGSENKKKLKDIGVRRISINIMHKHKYKIDLSDVDMSDLYYEDMTDFEYEEYQTNKYERAENRLNSRAMCISNDCVNKYIDYQLKKSSNKRLFHYKQDKDKFVFDYEINSTT